MRWCVKEYELRTDYVMKEWTQFDFFENNIWYHATTARNAEKILENGVIADINKNSQLDFGYGFYLCPNFEWAKNYLYGQLGLVDDDELIEPNDGYILEFDFKPNDFIEGKRIKFFDALNEEVAKFIFKNRMYYKYHLITHCVHNYALVGGPMSDGNQLDDFLDYKLHRITKGELFERLLLPKEDWQLLVHSQEICNALKVKKIYNLKGEEVHAI